VETAALVLAGYGQEDNLDLVRMLLADDHEDFQAVAAKLLEPESEVVKTVLRWAVVAR
jgi:hypothetical protein